MHRAVALPLAAVAAAVAGVTYANRIELRAFQLREVEVPVLRTGAEPVRILHISDLHITPGQQWKVAWVRGLAELAPDFVVNTGDSLAHPQAVPEAIQAMAPLFAFPGAFVPGSNDYYAPRLKNPLRYLVPDHVRRAHGERLPWPDLQTAMTQAGWFDLTNKRTTAKVGRLAVDLAGLDDPHIWLDRYDAIAGPVDAAADIGIGVV
ncbi:MAG TPA: metallophosphoesterase, partial [Mycobacteriales bacterium]|nr:metallophosphoesterase [Mycobacteriales bacterium]